MREAKLQRVSELAQARSERHLEEFKRMYQSEGPAIAVAVFISACADVVGAALATHSDPEIREAGQLGFALALMQATGKYVVQFEAADAIEKAKA